MNYDDLDSMLKKDEVLAHPAVFNWLAKRVSYPTNMKAGKYEIRKGMSLLNILKMLKKWQAGSCKPGDHQIANTGRSGRHDRKEI